MLDNEVDHSQENANEKKEESVEKPKEVTEETNIKSNIEIAEEKPNKVTFWNSFSATLIDEGIIGAISFGVLYLVDILMRLIAGFYIVDKVSMYLIIFVVITLLYISIMESKKDGKTFGKMAMKLKTTKIQ